MINNDLFSKNHVNEPLTLKNCNILPTTKLRFSTFIKTFLVNELLSQNKCFFMKKFSKKKIQKQKQKKIKNNHLSIIKLYIRKK